MSNGEDIVKADVERARGLDRRVRKTAIRLFGATPSEARAELQRIHGGVLVGGVHRATSLEFDPVTRRAIFKVGDAEVIVDANG